MEVDLARRQHSNHRQIKTGTDTSTTTVQVNYIDKIKWYWHVDYHSTGQLLRQIKSATDTSFTISWQYNSKLARAERDVTTIYPSFVLSLVLMTYWCVICGFRLHYTIDDVDIRTIDGKLGSFKAKGCKTDYQIKVSRLLNNKHTLMIEIKIIIYM